MLMGEETATRKCVPRRCATCCGWPLPVHCASSNCTDDSYIFLIWTQIVTLCLYRGWQSAVTGTEAPQEHRHMLQVSGLARTASPHTGANWFDTSPHELRRCMLDN